MPLSVGTHTIRISQYDYYGEMSLTATRMVTILPPPAAPEVLMKTFGFTFRVLGPDGNEVGPDGLATGDTIHIVASGVPVGTLITAEIHSTPSPLAPRQSDRAGRRTW